MRRGDKWVGFGGFYSLYYVGNWSYRSQRRGIGFGYGMHY